MPKMGFALPQGRSKSIVRYIFNAFFVTTQILFLAMLYHFVTVHYKKSTVTIFSALEESREHFVNSLRPFTTLKEANRDIATSNYLNSSSSDETEKKMLKLFIEDYMEFHAENRHNGTRRLIFRPRRTGMGDTFGTFIFAYWAAVVSKRVFLVDWQKPFPLEDLFKTASKKTDIFYRHDKDSANVDDSPKSRHIFLGENESRFIGMVESKVESIILSPKWLPSRETLDTFVKRQMQKRMPSRDVTNFLSSVSFRRAVAHHVLQLSDSVQKDHKTVSESMGLTIRHDPSKKENAFVTFSGGGGGGSGSPYIAVHARLGKGVGEKGSRFDALGKNVLIPGRCLASRAVRIAFMAGSPALPIYLATDTPTFRTIFKKVVKEISHGRVHVINGEWDTVHSSSLTFLMDSKDFGKEEDAKQWKAMWGSYMDLVMLGHAEHIVALYSSFPRFAFALGDAETLTQLRHDICTKEERWG